MAVPDVYSFKLQMSDHVSFLPSFTLVYRQTKTLTQFKSSLRYFLKHNLHLEDTVTYATGNSCMIQTFVTQKRKIFTVMISQLTLFTVH